jgi:hypothetical protein
VSLIRIHLRHVLCRAHLPLEIILRHVLRVCVADLIAGWVHYDTNMIRANRRASPITKKSEMRFNLARH